jgi:hypothetical protein
MNREPTLPNGAALRSRKDSVQSAVACLVDALNSSTSSVGELASGTCTVPGSGLVSPSAGPPSTDCRKMPGAPSRSDWKTTYLPSRDHTG